MTREDAIKACLDGKEVERHCNSERDWHRIRFYSEKGYFQMWCHWWEKPEWSRTDVHWYDDATYRLYEEPLPELMYPPWLKSGGRVEVRSGRAGYFIRVAYNDFSHCFDFNEPTKRHVTELWNALCKAAEKHLEED